MSESNTRMIGGFLAGAAIGAGVVYLFATASGKQTRRRLAEGAQELSDAAQSSLADLTNGLQDRMKDTLKDGVALVGEAALEGRAILDREVGKIAIERDRL